MGPVLDRDKAVTTPLTKDAWIVEPEKKNVSSTITHLIKDNYPSTYRPLDEHGQEVPPKDAKVIAHYHNYPTLTRITILREFLGGLKNDEEQHRQSGRSLDGDDPWLFLDVWDVKTKLSKKFYIV